jgi:hypothetical protein
MKNPVDSKNWYRFLLVPDPVCQKVLDPEPTLQNRLRHTGFFYMKTCSLNCSKKYRLKFKFRQTLIEKLLYLKIFGTIAIFDPDLNNLDPDQAKNFMDPPTLTAFDGTRWYYLDVASSADANIRPNLKHYFPGPGPLPTLAFEQEDSQGVIQSAHCPVCLANNL